MVEKGEHMVAIEREGWEKKGSMGMVGSYGRITVVELGVFFFVFFVFLFRLVHKYGALCARVRIHHRLCLEKHVFLR